MSPKPRIEMSESELELIAAFTDVPLDKVRGIVWLAEWRMREQAPSRYLPLGPIGGAGPNVPCGASEENRND